MSTTSSKQTAFTIVELLIVIVVIGILAAITIVAYNGVQTRAKNARRDSDVTTLQKAILAARANTGQTTVAITGVPMTSLNCSRTPGNAGLVEPKTLDKSHSCWTEWRQTLDRLGAAASMNLTGLYNGDPSGNPYYMNENEGEAACMADDLGYFTESGVNFVITKTVAAGGNC